MHFPANCLLAALVAWIMAPRVTRIRRMRNRCGRWHWYWQKGKEAYEFKGAVPRWSFPYWRNLVYLGRVERFV